MLFPTRPRLRTTIPCLVLFAAALVLPAAGWANEAIEGGDRAIAACRKHVESMLRESTGPQYGEGLRVERVDDRTVNVSGFVRSTSRAGQLTQGDFRCRATRSGVIWTTRTELLFQP